MLSIPCLSDRPQFFLDLLPCVCILFDFPETNGCTEERKKEIAGSQLKECFVIMI